MQSNRNVTQYILYGFHQLIKLNAVEYTSEVKGMQMTALRYLDRKIKEDFTSPEMNRYLPWFLKYQLKSYDDLIITSEIKKIINFLENRPKDKGLLLYGEPGSGKTTTANLIANHFYKVFP